MKKAFTLAEVLITLAIIGVVAALTIPTLVVNYQKKVTMTKLKKEYNYINNAFRAYMATEGVNDMKDTTLWKLMPSSGVMGDTITPHDFAGSENSAFRNELNKIFRIADVTTIGNPPVNYEVKVKRMNGEDEVPMFPGVIILQDGTILYTEFFTRPNRAYCNSGNCTSLEQFQKERQTPTRLWEDIAHILIAPNGFKENIVMGKDLFDYRLGSNGIIYPKAGIDDAVYSGCSYSGDMSKCSQYWKNEGSPFYSCVNTSNIAGHGCIARIMEEGWEMNY